MNLSAIFAWKRRFKPASPVNGLRLKRFLRNARGVAAVEFAYLCPLLMLMTFGTFEMTRALIVHKRFQRASAMVGDLIAREQQIGTTSVDAPLAMSNIMISAAQVLNPYSASPLKVAVTQLRASSSNASDTTVEWSYPYNGASVTSCGSKKSMPASNMVTAGNAAIVVETKYAYTPLLTNIIPGLIKPVTWTGTITYAPRYGSVFYAQATQNTKCPPGTG